MNPQPLRVLFASSEVVPYSKTGGLADVAGALPEALAGLGCEVRVISPFYASLFHRDHPTVPVDPPLLAVELGGLREDMHVRAPAQKTTRAEFAFLEHAEFFSRSALYVSPATGADYADNDRRFAYFSCALLEYCLQSGWIPDIIHLNDWQTALAAPYLKEKYQGRVELAGTRTILTVHNLAYQGVFPHERFGFLGFDKRLIDSLGPFEFFGKTNFLKAGLEYADQITTVSPTYAREIQASEELGAGLDGVLRRRSHDLAGILNGIDDGVWNPATDPLLPATYDAEHLTGKAECKSALCQRCGIAPERAQLPLVGMITRLDRQKGLDLVAEAEAELMSLDANFVLLGTGSPAFHQIFENWNQQYPGRFRAFLAFDNALAHLIEAGADMFLMPSRYEPCGLNQMYSLRYGTIPVVRSTGGLVDTVFDCDADPERGNGFAFSGYNTTSLIDAIRRALATFAFPERWNGIMRRGMGTDFSWRHAAGEYQTLFERVRV
jgi:starch synthase